MQRNNSETCSDSLLLYSAGADPLYRNEYNGLVTRSSLGGSSEETSLLHSSAESNIDNVLLLLVLHVPHRALAQAASRPLRRFLTL